ncbi:GGDEF domain-containing protein [Paramaledivibacter caminithermalis]|jgi:GGDEF domain-containing protein|uniref:GGDEF domain-containing protein, diguanylate cyclase (C-di-GMP synthetase) or its enzymatically inactive variants n=1 Tax=Paramaledivibacter caminithermalis (strain DSM 15212 / CIP 107654 / DViRD3) TaxID=1121301 RepID=A0A1M6MT24_PARC5|nr:diguanylate cyclase [Paramaledivibacter caminithermalis]SHJ86540.1 GGDEF domain-containing protein, diguanylate cyclase (c-di-GMP synthetase) or its enzymatically inactive variants [Paramaledivibacter caminithermalis DSM 15212]
MKTKLDNQISKKLDILDTTIITIFFILLITFSYGGLNRNPMNVFIVLWVMIGMIVGYYTNITFAILYSIIFDFIYSSLHIFLNMSKSIPIDPDVYFWIITLPIITLMYAYKGKLIREIQLENKKLKKENEELVMIDKETGLRSSQSFFNEIQAYMNISKRYGVETYLMLIKIKYQNEVINILGEDKYNKIIMKLSKLLDDFLREEDKKFILRDMNLFGIILLSNKNGGKQVVKRLKEMIYNIEFEEEAVINKMKIEIIVGLAIYDEETINNPYEFFQMAKKDMEYDV